ncbi:hypothetical protein D3C87_587690 [compost metagenome]
MNFKVESFDKTYYDSYLGMNYGVRVVMPMAWDDALCFSIVTSLDSFCLDNFGKCLGNWSSNAKKEGGYRSDLIHTACFRWRHDREKFIGAVRDIVVIAKLEYVG